MPAYDADLFFPPAPVARVILRNSQTSQTVSDISLLIDSGADVTLIPQTAVDELGITTDAEHYDRGKFLISDQEFGILGRDILNHVSIVLDGPRLTWRESN